MTDRLDKMRTKVENDIIDLRAKLRQAEDVLLYLKEAANQEDPEDSSPVVKQQMGVTEAIRSIFDEKPTTYIRPSAIIGMIQGMIDQGRIRMKPGRDPKKFVYSILGQLVKSDELERHEHGRDNHGRLVTVYGRKKSS